MLEAVGFDHRLEAADAAVSGEGRLDEQSLEGKLVGVVAERCRAAYAPLHLIVGAAAGERIGQRLGAAGVEVASTLDEIAAAAQRVTT